MTAMRTLKPTAFMRNRLFKIGMGLAAAGAMMFSSAAVAAPTMKALSGHVPPAVSRLQSKGSLSATNSLRLALGLPLRNQAALSNLLQQIYDPASPNYHHYLTPEEFTAQFGPTEEDYQKVIAFAKAGGLTVIGTHPNRMLLDVAGNAGNVGSAFHVAFRVYHHPTENRDFYAPDTNPTVDASLPILHISGLDNYSTAHPALKSRPAGQPAVGKVAAAGSASGGKPAIGSGPGGTYEGSDFRTAYVPGTSLTGSGQSVGLFEMDGFYASDVAAYENQIGLTGNLPQVFIVPVDGGVPVPTPFGNPEVALDIDMVLSMSPGVATIYVYEGPNESGVFDDILNRMANDNLVKQIGCSWYIFNGPPDPVAEAIFQQMALQGQTFFTASGDSDAYTGLIPFPGDSPHITTVGGTTLTTGTGAGYASETVWNWGVEYGDDGVGSSGGISTTYSIPSWQTNVSFAFNGGSATMRNVPDVALTADNVWVIFGDGSSGSFGGTSCAAPLWAGFTALVNQQAALNSHAPVGFLNPAIYAIAANGQNYRNCFNDITTGNNEWSGSPNLFSATRGYDLCTGLGTPNGTNLINALASSSTTITHLSPPPPPYGSTLAVLDGVNPNGNWYLYELDDGVFDSGVITNGWILNLTTASPVGGAADNALSMTASAGNIAVGGNGVYILTVTNYGPSSATNVLVSDNLPSGVTFVSATPTLGSVTLVGTTLEWNVGVTNAGQFVLATNTGAQLTVTVQLPDYGSFTSYAIVTAGTPDPNPDDASANATLNATIVTPPGLSGVATASGGKFVFSVTSASGQTNVVQSSTNLINWVPVFTNVGPFTFTNTILPGYPVQFYRDLILGP
jgi:uncharacterized repeat protein (TIGR01451 family)